MNWGIETEGMGYLGFRDLRVTSYEWGFGNWEV